MRDPALNPLVERRSELSAIDTAVDEAAEGEGCLIVVEGPAGIGKTRLLRAARDAASEHDHPSLLKHTSVTDAPGRRSSLLNAVLTRMSPSSRGR